MYRESDYKKVRLSALIWDVLMLAVIILMYIYSDSKTDNYLFYRACLLFCVYGLVVHYSNHRLLVPTTPPQFSYALFLLYAGISMLWASTMQMPAFRLLLVAVAMSVTISVYLNDEKSFDKLAVAFVIAGILLSITVFNNYGSNLFSLGRRIRLDNFNANNIGIMLALSIFACIYLFLRYKKRIILVLIPFFSVIIMLSGSRKALFAAGVIIAVVFIKSSTSPVKVIVRIIAVCLGLVLVWQVIMNVSWAYQAIGYRLDSTMNMIFYGELGEDQNRIRMIELALHLFNRSPIVGNGLDTFRVLNGVFDSYCHSNFFELLCDFGVVGTLIYYIRYVRILKIRKGIFKNTISSMMYLLMIIMLVYEFAAVSYYTVFFQIVFAVGYKGTEVFKKLGEEDV